MPASLLITRRRANQIMPQASAARTTLLGSGTPPTLATRKPRVTFSSVGMELKRNDGVVLKGRSFQAAARTPNDEPIAVSFHCLTSPPVSNEPKGLVEFG